MGPEGVSRRTSPVATPGLEEAATSRGDQGKAEISGAAVAARPVSDSAQASEYDGGVDRQRTDDHQAARHSAQR